MLKKISGVSLSESLFDRDTIVRSLNEVASVLEDSDSDPAVLVVVGGSYLALHGLRESTADIDTVRRMEASLRAAVEVVAERRDFSPNWLNDRAAPFTPIGLSIEESELLFEHPRLRAYGPPPRLVFAMKLYAGRAPDHDDMVALWPHCGFENADEALHAYHAAYPHAPDDEYLLEYVRTIARQAQQ